MRDKGPLESKLGKKLDTELGRLKKKEFDRLDRVNRLNRAMKKFRPLLDQKKKRQEREQKQRLLRRLKNVKRPKGFETRRRKAISELESLMRGMRSARGLRYDDKEQSRGTRLGLIRGVVPFKRYEELAKQSAADPREEKFIKKELLDIARQEGARPRIIGDTKTRRPTRKQ